MEWDDLLPKERAFLLGWNLGKKAKLTTADIARDYAVTQKHASRLMNDLSRIAPIIRSETGEWMDVEVYMIDCGDDV